MRHILQGMHYFSASLKQKVFGITKLGKSIEEIKKNIIKNCWNGTYFMTSSCHYREFWARDFGFFISDLIELGFKKECRKTLNYALNKFKKKGSITTTISREGKPFSFPNAYSVDSLALLLYSLYVLGDMSLVEKYSSFLQSEIDKFFKNVLDKHGRVWKDRHFSGMRDYAIRHGSCYDQTMAALLCIRAKQLGFKVKFNDSLMQKRVLEYWNGNWFDNDKYDKHFASDSNILPFWTGVIDSKTKFKKVLKFIQSEGLDNPLPLKYSSEKDEKMHLFEIFVPNWERNQCWTNIGLLFLKVCYKYNKKAALKYRKKFYKVVRKYGTLLEVYDSELKPYTSRFYHSDESMIWIAGL